DRGTDSFSLRVWAGLAIILLAVQAAGIHCIGRLFDNKPVPILYGPCGYVQRLELTDDNVSASSRMYLKSRRDATQTTALTCLECSGHDSGESMECPGPAGQNFTWRVLE